MPQDPNPDDDERLAAYAAALADGVEAALPRWVERAVVVRHGAALGAPPPAVLDQARAAGADAVDELVPELRRLLGTDVDAQWTNPLSIVRGAVRHPTRVLRAAGVPPRDRDAEAVRQFPDDPYDLTPAAFADLDPDLHEPGLVWGAAKAYVVLARRRAEGRT